MFAIRFDEAKHSLPTSLRSLGLRCMVQLISEAQILSVARMNVVKKDE